MTVTAMARDHECPRCDECQWAEVPRGDGKEIQMSDEIQERAGTHSRKRDELFRVSLCVCVCAKVPNYVMNNL